jgi:hypothetical protein
VVSARHRAVFLATADYSLSGAAACRTRIARFSGAFEVSAELGLEAAVRFPWAVAGVACVLQMENSDLKNKQKILVPECGRITSATGKPAVHFRRAH